MKELKNLTVSVWRKHSLRQFMCKLHRYIICMYSYKLWFGIVLQCFSKYFSFKVKLSLFAVASTYTIACRKTTLSRQLIKIKLFEFCWNSASKTNNQRNIVCSICSERDVVWVIGSQNCTSINKAIHYITLYNSYTVRARTILNQYRISFVPTELQNDGMKS